MVGRKSINPILKIEGISKSFIEGKKVLHNISLEVEKSSIISLLGLSGSGKTTLMRILMGLEKADEGSILQDGQVMDELPPYERKIGMVFQDFGLLPHINAFDNIAFGLKYGKEKLQDSNKIKKRIDDMVEILKLGDCLDQYPDQLSGGEKQRVALGRTLVMEPVILILDEPTSSLDVLVKESVQKEIKNLQRELGITTLIITHDQYEAFYLSDKIAILNEGKIDQVDTPMNIYKEPQTDFVRYFFSDQIRLKMDQIQSILK